MSYNENSIHVLSPGKSDFLNLVRWTAALVVVLGHADMYLGQFSGNPERWTSFGYLGAHSHTAVMIFFVLSGYVVWPMQPKKRLKMGVLASGFIFLTGGLVFNEYHLW
jgi:peptidoglycan/LPS O-acetylase OafA/YrhL